LNVNMGLIVDYLAVLLQLQIPFQFFWTKSQPPEWARPRPSFTSIQPGYVGICWQERSNWAKP
jgi:hypothetical protein